MTQVIKSTPKTFQFGIIKDDGTFHGVTLKGDNLTYDVATGLPLSGKIKWMEYSNFGSPDVGDYGGYTLANLPYKTVEDLFDAQPIWYQWAGFGALMFHQSVPQTVQIEGNFNAPFTGSNGNDRITSTSDEYGLYAWGNDGEDTIIGSGTNDRLLGDAGQDILRGRAGNDRIEGGTGNDALRGDEGRDTLWGNDGADTLYGGVRDDLLYGDDAYFIAEAKAGSDKIFGGAGRDRIYGGDGEDRLKGGTGNDQLTGGHGNDKPYGGDGDDTLIAGEGVNATVSDDILFGGAGNDFLSDELGNDKMFGGTGNDYLTVVGGNDMASGGEGEDVITVRGPGHAILSGGADADQFLFVISVTESVDIRDFNASEDVLRFGYEVDTTQQEQFDAFLAGAVQYGHHVRWTEGDTTVLIRRNDLDDLTLDNFVDTMATVIGVY